MKFGLVSYNDAWDGEVLEPPTFGDVFGRNFWFLYLKTWNCYKVGPGSRYMWGYNPTYSG